MSKAELLLNLLAITAIAIGSYVLERERLLKPLPPLPAAYPQATT